MDYSYGFLSIAESMMRNIGKNRNKNLSVKYSLGMLAARQNFFDHAKKSGTDSRKTASKKVI